MVEDFSVANIHGIYRDLTIVPDANVSFTVVIKAASPGREFFALRVFDVSDSNPMYTDVFTPSTGSYLGAGSVLGTGVAVSRTITPLKNGWYRYNLVANLGSGLTNVRFFLAGRDNASTTYTGDGRIAFYYETDPVIS
jgi:hypothetical protein